MWPGKASSLVTFLALLALTGLALALRLHGLDFLLPLQVEPDADIVVQVALIDGNHPHPEQVRDYGRYPHLVARAVTLLTAPPNWDESSQDAGLEQHLARASRPLVRVRLVVVLLSLLAVPATWLIARHYLARAWSLLAASAMVTSLLALWFAQQARPHAASMGLPALAVAGCIALRRRPTLGTYLVAGAACGLAIASLQSGIAVLLPLAAAHLVACRGRGWYVHVRLVLPLAIVALCGYAFYPFLFTPVVGQATRITVDGNTLNQGGHKIFLNLFNGGGLRKMTWDLWSYDPALFIGSVLGIGAWLAGLTNRRFSAPRLPRADHAVVLAYALPYFALVALYQRSYQRFLLPLLPFLACLSAYGLSALARGRRAQRAGVAAPFAVGLLVVLWVGFPALVALRLVQARHGPNTFELAGDWLRKNATPEADRIALGPTLQVPLFDDPAEIERATAVAPRGLLWAWYEKRVFRGTWPQPHYRLFWIPPRDITRIGRSPRPYVKSLEADYVVTEVYAEGRRHPALGALREGLASMATLEARISPDGDGVRSLQPISYQDDEVPNRVHVSARILRARAVGPVIEIYRLDGAPSDPLARRGSQ